MKKILATLIVATMIMSCMSFVSFAATVEVHTASAYPYAELGAISIDDEALADSLGKTVLSEAYDLWKAATGGTLSKSNYRKSTNVYLALYNAEGAIEDIIEADDPEAAYEEYLASAKFPTELALNDLVAYPVYGTAVKGVNINVTFDDDYLTYAGMVNAGMTVDGQCTGNVVSLAGMATDDTTGLLGVIFFAVKADAVGDPSGKASIVLKGEVTAAQGSTGYATVGNTELSVALSGLKEGQPVVQDKDITAADITVAPVKAMAEDADAAGMAADLATFGVEVPSDVATNKYVYNAIFAKIPTTGYNAPSAYGIILNTAKGAKKVTVTNAVNGKFGVFVYGSTYALDGIESYQVFCTVNGVDVLGEVVAY